MKGQTRLPGPAHIVCPDCKCRLVEFAEAHLKCLVLLSPIGGRGGDGETCQVLSKPRNQKHFCLKGERKASELPNHAHRISSSLQVGAYRALPGHTRTDLPPWESCKGSVCGFEVSAGAPFFGGMSASQAWTVEPILPVGGPDGSFECKAQSEEPNRRCQSR